MVSSVMVRDETKAKLLKLLKAIIKIQRDTIERFVLKYKFPPEKENYFN